MRRWQDEYVDRFYRSRPGWIDGTTEFHGVCAGAINQGARILEIGAGPSNPTSRFLASLGELHGLDRDPVVVDNDALLSAKILTDEEFPFPDAYFDACASNYVLEHIEDPRTHLLEVARVLRPGGVYVFRTPNRLYYTSVVAAVTPHWFHELVSNRLRALPTGAHDPYPTHFAMNSRRAIVTHALHAEFSVEHFRIIEKEPSYGMAARFLFMLLMGYEKFVNSTARLEWLRANIIAVLRKHNSAARDVSPERSQNGRNAP